MSSFDLGQKIKASTLIAAQAWDGDADLTTADALAVDTAGAEGVAVVITTGVVEADADHVIEFHEVAATTTAPGAGNKIPDSRIVKSPDITATDNAAYVYAIKPNARYLKVVLKSATDKNAALAVTAILGYLSEVPA